MDAMYAENNYVLKTLNAFEKKPLCLIKPVLFLSR